MNKLLNTKINLDYINQFNPCQSGVDRFIKAGYKNFNGNIVDFINLDKIPFTDIKWVIFNTDQKLLNDELLREFAFTCTLRAVERVNIEEITNFWMISYLMYISGEYDRAAHYSAHSATHSSAHSSANYATYSAVYYAARSAVNFAARSAANSAYSAVYSANDYSTDYAARSAACSTAYHATDRLKEENIQKEILIDLITKYKE